MIKIKFHKQSSHSSQSSIKLNPLSTTTLSPDVPRRIRRDMDNVTTGGWFNHVFRLSGIVDDMTRRGLPIDVEALEEFKYRLMAYEELTREDISEHVTFRGSELGREFTKRVVCKELPDCIAEKLKEMSGKVKVTKHKNGTTSETRLKKEFTTNGDAKYPVLIWEYEDWFREMIETWPRLEDGSKYEWFVDEGNIGWIHKVYPFNPASVQQLTEYVKACGYDIREKTKKTAKGKEKKESLDDDELARLDKETNDPIFSLIRTLREKGKLRSTYAEGYMPNGKDGRLHSTFTFMPATGQLSSRNPNVQVIPRDTEDADEFKRCIRAREGRVLVNCDFTGYHALMLGYLADCPEYMRLSRLGVHDYVASYILRDKIHKMVYVDGDRGSVVLTDELREETIEHLKDLDLWISYDDKTLKGKLSWIKNNHTYTRSKIAKPTILGVGFGMGANKMSETYPDSFPTKAHAQGIIDVVKRLFPAIFHYQEFITRLAHKQGYLISPFGAMRRFHDAMTYNQRGELIGGEDAEKAKAFLPANCAFSVKKDVLIRLEEMGALERYYYILDVHDSLVFECPVELWEECVRVVVGEMMHPVELLDGLVCDVEAEVGPNYKDMKKVNLRELGVV